MENPYESPPENHPASDEREPATGELNHSFLRKVRILGFIEGVSTLILFGIAMPMKYMMDIPLAVRICGMAHGILFTLLVIMLVMAIKRVPLPSKLAMLGMGAAVLPFGPFIFDRQLHNIDATDKK